MVMEDAVRGFVDVLYRHVTEDSKRPYETSRGRSKSACRYGWAYSNCKGRTEFAKTMRLKNKRLNGEVSGDTMTFIGHLHNQSISQPPVLFFFNVKRGL
jgi:hypothetical protein